MGRERKRGGGEKKGRKGKGEKREGKGRLGRVQVNLR